MINNRQNGRRRGRGGNGPRTPGTLPNQNNRQDNRSRGNAAQLHEKYKALARDAQLAGDRVQTEYFLQFADHYFRVLNETRARFEEQRPRRDDYMDDEDDGEDMIGADDGGDDQPQQHQPPRRDREPRPERFERQPRDAREPREAREPRLNREPREMRPPRASADSEEVAQTQPAPPQPHYAEPRGEQPSPEPRRRGRPRRDAGIVADAPAGERISLDVLPPAIAPVSDPVPGLEGEAVKAPRRRAVRRPRAESGEDIAPAA